MPVVVVVVTMIGARVAAVVARVVAVTVAAVTVVAVATTIGARVVVMVMAAMGVVEEEVEVEGVVAIGINYQLFDRKMMVLSC